MMAPRSFLFTRQNMTPSSSPSNQPVQRDKPPVVRRNASTKNGISVTSATTTTTTTESRPSTPTSPVVIPPPTRSSHESPRSQPRNERPQRPRTSRKASGQSERRARTVHSADAMPPSVAALLAITTIPVHKTNSTRKRGASRPRLTVDAILQHTGGAEMEKELSRSLSQSHLDFLLSPPDELEDDEFLVGSDVGLESVLSTRTMSSESMPSLDGDSTLSPSPSLRSLVTPGSRGRKSLPKRHVLLSSPPAHAADHPLLTPNLDIDGLDFRVFEKHHDDEETPIEIQVPVRKSAFKSNLTASLRALASAARSSAKSFSTLTAPMITPDDFLTRSIIAIDPRVPFTDERMPPKLEDTPTPALRRYLNPTTNAPIEAHVPSSLAQTTGTTKCTASIQMQTYKVSRSARGSSPTVISRRTQPTSEDAYAEVAAGPVARQRDMRENCDFIRIAVMEMAMRKKGKLDDQKPGRARWALPPRQPSTTPYAIGENGVPVRWIAVTY